MTLTQIVEIPADRRVRFDIEVPREIPEGKAQFELKVVSFVKKDEDPENGRKKLGMTMKEIDELLKTTHTPHSDALAGILSDIGDISIEQIREERLAKKYPEYFK